jgi:hypothetical protein
LKPSDVEPVITGRNVDPRVLERADLVTEMREVKHYYARGVEARKGIESQSRDAWYTRNDGNLWVNMGSSVGLEVFSRVI